MSAGKIHDLVLRALEEDVGPGDATSESVVPADARARARIVQKAPGVIFGLDGAEVAFRELDSDVRLERRVEEGVWRESGEVLDVEGAARAVLTAERTALNLLGRLSGVATATARAVREVEGTGARILDTRKTTPGWRALEKAAVRKAMAERPDLLVEAECRDRAEVDAALAAGAPRLLLDNMGSG